MRHNQTLTADQLRTEATTAAEASGRTRADIAAALGVTPAAITHALNEGRDASRYAALLGRIVEEVTGYTVEEVTPTYRVLRKQKG